MKRLFSVVLSLMLIVGMMPSYAFAALGIGDINVIKTPSGGKEIKPATQTVTIWNGDQQIEQGGTIDQGKDMKIKVDFTLPDIPVGTEGEPDFTAPNATNKGDYMSINLPKEMNFANEETRSMPMEVSGTEGLIMGELTVQGTQAMLVFSEDAANPDYQQRGGKWEASIKINWEEVTEETENVVFTIFGKEYTVTVKPEANPDRIEIAKKGKADISKGKITWTVTTTPSREDLTYDGYTFTDKLPNTVTYVEDSFSITPSAIDESKFSYDADKNTISYQFPAEVTGVQTISYDTLIKDLAANNGKEIISKNEAVISNGSTTNNASDTVSVTPNWISKNGEYKVGNHSIDWTITVNESGATLKNAVVTDDLPKGLTLVTKGNMTELGGSVPKVAMTQNGGTTVEIPEKADAGESRPYYTLSADNQMKIHLGDLTAKATITFTTKLDNTVQSSVKNTAYINWDEGSSIEGGGASATGSAEPSISQAFISKKAGTYDFTNNVMPWTITVNSAKQNISYSRVMEIFAYHTDKVTPIKSSDVDKNKLPEKFKDHTINVNQQFIGGSLSLEGAAATQIEQEIPFTQKGQYKLLTVDLGNKKEAQILEIYTGELSASPETVTLNTMLTDKNAYGVNGRGSDYQVTNTAFLHTGNLENERIVSATGTAKLRRHIIEKRVEKGYDYKDRTITWKIDFNHNGLQIADGVINDAMPVGWDVNGSVADWSFFELYEGTNPVFNSNPSLTKGRQITGEELKNIIESVDVIDFAKGQKLVTFKLKPINKPYVLLLKTKLTEEGANQIFAENKSVAVRNDASMTGSSILGAPSDYENPAISNNMLSKSGALVKESPGEVLWTVNVNQNGIELPKDKDVDKVYVVDEFKNYLAPKMIGNDYAVAIWKVERQADGTMTSGEALPNEEVQKLIKYDKGSNTMSIELPTTKDAYRIQVVTSITDDDVKTVTNAVQLQGVKTNITSSQQPESTITLSANAWGTVAGKITVKKTDSDSTNPKYLPGAVFKLYETSIVDGENVKNDTYKYMKATNAAGSLEFKYLRAGTYWLEEVTPPVGYKLGAKPGQLVTLTQEEGKVVDVSASFVNEQLKGAIQLSKVDGSGNALAGAEFTLYKTVVLPANVVSVQKSQANGGVIFENVGAGTYFVKETAAPKGHKLSGTVVKAVVDVNGNVTYYTGGDQKGTQEIPVISNEAFTADIVVYKKDKTDGTLLGGAEFTLYDERSMVVGVSTTTAQDGLAWFRNIPYGKYTIKETKAPEGYDLNSASAEIIEKYFDENGTRIKFEFVDQKAQTGGGDNPPTDPDNPPTDPDNPPTDPDNPPTDPDNPPTEPDPNPDNPGGGGGGSSSGGSGGSNYDPPTVDIQDPETPLAEGVETPTVPETPAVLPATPEQILTDIGDDGNPLGDKDLRDPAKLPKTGGMGTELFWVLGGALTALGASLRKKENKEQSKMK